MSEPSATARLMGPSAGTSEASAAGSDPMVFSFVLRLMCSASFGRSGFASVKSTEMSAVRCSDYVAAQVRR